MRTAKYGLDSVSKLASVQWNRYSQEKGLSSGPSADFVLSLVAYAEKLSILSGHFAAVSLAKHYFHGFYDSGGKRSGSFLQSAAIFNGNLDVIFNVHVLSKEL